MAIVSDKAGGAKGHWAGVWCQRPWVPPGDEPDYGIKRARMRSPLWPCQSRRLAAKGTADNLLGAVLGKTRRTES